MTKIIIIFPFIFLLFYVNICGQVSFNDQTAVYNPSLDLRSGSAGGFADLNGDGLDDLIIINKATHLVIGYNMGADRPMHWVEGPKVSSSREFLCLITDLENDGINELITSGSFSNTKVYRKLNNDNYAFSQLIKESILAQGGNAVDIDNDGFLDYFLCSDEGDNLVAINDQNGSLDKRLDYIDWATVPVSDHSGNYSSEWADVNNDGRLDFVIAKCRLGVTDSSDPRRINRLMIQQADGTFRDEAAERGLASGYQSWTANLADFDNDGDFDCLVTNHDHPHQWFINDGNGYFTPKEIHPSLPRNFSFQSHIRDYNNDGFLDAFIPGDALNLLLINQEGTSFEVIENPLGNPATSATVGDINDDGKIDINAFYPTNINFPGQTKDRIFVNSTDNENNYIDIKLIGQESNILAIGSVARVYSELGIQTQVVKGGESYGVTNSFVLHFGLGGLTEVDSVVISWSSGNKTVFNPEFVNKKFEIEEGQCFLDNIELYEEPLYLCNDSILLEAPPHYFSYKWSNGNTERTLNVTKQGVYQVSMLNDTGCVVRSTPISVMNGTLESPLIKTNESLVGCHLDSFELNGIAMGKEYLWNDSLTNPTYIAHQEQTVYLEVLNHCDDWQSDSISLHLTNPNEFSAVGDTVMVGETAIIKAEGENINWYTSPIAQNSIFNGQELSIVNIQNTQQFYAENTSTGFKSNYVSGMNIMDLDQYLHEDSISYDLQFTVFEPLVIREATINAIKPGMRKFVVRNEQLNVVDEIELFINEGVHTYTFNLNLPIGQLIYLGTDPLYNLDHLGTTSPQLTCNLNGIDYPYAIGSKGDIISSTGSKALYPYFYDIVFGAQPFECVSDRKEVIVFLDTDVNTEDISDEVLNVYPNPSTDFIRISTAFIAKKLKIYDVLGNCVMEKDFNNKHDYDISKLKSGMYLIELTNESRSIVKSFIKH